MSLRERIVRRLEISVERRGYPRTAVALIVALAALVSLILSIVLVEFGLTDMGVRYLICLVFGYLVFLALLRLLASRHFADLDPGIDLSGSGRSGGSSPDSFSGGGGEFGGGGASSTWGPTAVDPTASSAQGSDAVADSVSGLDLDEGWVVAIPLVILAGAALASGYVVMIAPVLVAEVALDVAIAAGAYRAAATLDPQHWTFGAVRRTWLAVLGLAILVGGFGFGLQALAPDAHTIGAAIASL
jgi:hypothetical protein